MASPQIKLYLTTLSPSVKVKADIDRLKHILAAKQVVYEEVDLSLDRSKRDEMELASNGLKSLPQLHVNGKFFGDADTIQEYIDFGEFDQLLKEMCAAQTSAEPVPAQA